MSTSDLILLKEKRDDYIDKLYKVSHKLYIDTFKGLYDETLRKNKQKKLLLKEFQQSLCVFASWDDDKVQSVYTDFVTNYPKYDSLIFYIFKLFINIYYKLNNKKFNYVSIPSSQKYTHECYLSIARRLWKEPNLFYDSGSKVNYQNLERVEYLIRKSISETFISLLPTLSKINYDDTDSEEDEAINREGVIVDDEECADDEEEEGELEDEEEEDELEDDEEEDGELEDDDEGELEEEGELIDDEGELEDGEEEEGELEGDEEEEGELEDDEEEEGELEDDEGELEDDEEEGELDDDEDEGELEGNDETTVEENVKIVVLGQSDEDLNNHDGLPQDEVYDPDVKVIDLPKPEERKHKPLTLLEKRQLIKQKLKEGLHHKRNAANSFF